MTSVYHHKLKHIKASIYVLMLANATIALTGCQSTTAPTGALEGSSALIDYSSANAAQIQAQGKAFNDSLSANATRYSQLFDTDKSPNSEQQAKQRLMAAIRQHMATDHVAVAQANYQAVPFIDADSIDAGASSLLRTIIDVYAYNQSNQYDDDVASAEREVADATVEYCNDDPDDDAYEVCYVEDTNDAVLTESATAFEVSYEIDDIEYDADGYDIDGLDVEGYDRNGYDYYGLDQSGYDRNGYDYYGYDRDGYDEYGSTAADDEGYEGSEGQGIRERIASNRPRKFLSDYEAMKAEQSATSKADRMESGYPGTIGQIFGMIHKTPEQVTAANIYQYKHLTFNSVSHYKPQQRQFQSVYSYDYAAPTISSSVQIPLALDFNNSRVTIDPAAIMPIVALINPENTPLPNQMMSNTVDFGLPEVITSQLPSAVLYDAAIKAMQDSMAEIEPESFSAIDIRGDDFAKQVKASQAVKIYFGSKQTGELVGRMLKYMSVSLQQYVDANPEQYPDGAVLKTAIDKIQLYNEGYQSADVGSLLQLIEAVLPISFNQVNYYYLNNANQLLAKQQRLNIGSDLLGSQTTVINQVRYDRKSFEQHKLTPLLMQAFGANANPAIDGDAWLAKQRAKTARLDQARYARYGYDTDKGDYNYDDNDSYDNDSDDFASDAAVEQDYDTDSDIGK